MSTKSLSKVYEELKELRRRHSEPISERDPQLARQLKALYDDLVGQGLPDRFSELIRKLDVDVNKASTTVIRALEIKTLADRVFGDEEKAEVWLERPNRSLSGQRPADLLKDELGAAVVREMLERIDHGIFA